MELKKAIYTIEEAANLLACRQEQLLSDAIAKKFYLYVRTPEHLDLYNVGRKEIIQPDIKWADGQRHSWRAPQAHREPEVPFLIIPEEGISLILKGDLYIGSTFWLGGAINSDGDVAVMRPSTPQHKGPYFSVDLYLRHFATYRAGIGDLYKQNIIKHPQKFSIKSSDLLISRVDLNTLLAPANEIISNRPLGFPELDVQLDHVGENLKKLYSLFCETWECWGSDKFSLPQRETISHSLKTDLGFSNHLTELGVRVILDVLSDTDARTGSPRIVASWMNSLIKGSTVHWKPIPDQHPPNPRKEVVQAWFAKNGIDKSHVIAAATMIRPKAPKGRKPGYSE